MKYKVGDKVRVKEWKDLELEYEVDEYGDICHGAMFIQEMKEYCGKELVIEQVWNDRYSCHGISYLWQDWMFEDVVEQQIDHESVILQLTELNELTARKLVELMKFIAKDYTITNDLDYYLIRETLLKDIRDEDLVSAIMYHVRKGK